MYVTQQDMIDAFGNQELLELTNLDDPSAVQINQINLNRALEDANSTIDSFLRNRYTLPLEQPPKSLTRVGCDLARYWLDRYQKREDVRQRYEDAMAFLKDIFKGLISLVSDHPITNIGGPQFFANDRIFTEQSLGDYL